MGQTGSDWKPLAGVSWHSGTARAAGLEGTGGGAAVPGQPEVGPGITLPKLPTSA